MTGGLTKKQPARERQSGRATWCELRENRRQENAAYRVLSTQHPIQAAAALPQRVAHLPKKPTRSASGQIRSAYRANIRRRTGFRGKVPLFPRNLLTSPASPPPP